MYKLIFLIGFVAEEFFFGVIQNKIHKLMKDKRYVLPYTTYDIDPSIKV